MKLQEYMAKGLLREAGVPVPPGKVAETPEEVRYIADEFGYPIAVKAQVLVGGRGKAGGIKVARTPQEAYDAGAQILGMDLKGLIVKKVLVEKGLEIESEFYAGLTVDRANSRTVLILSAMGGIDIEEVARDHPDAISKVGIDPAFGLLPFQVTSALFEAGFSGPMSEIAKIVSGLARMAADNDAVLAEINPLAVTKTGEAIAADCKVELDDSAMYRHPVLNQFKEETADDPLELYASQQGLPYVRLEGDIGIIGNGAGLVMMTLDIVRQVGGTPANFLDIGGGAKAEVVKKAIEVVLMDTKVKGIVMNIFGGITRGDEVAKGLLEASSTMDVRVPIAIRLAGTRAKEGLALLEGSKFKPASDVETAARSVLTAVGGNA
jgi:succinyl-CoA synthetase beta subunit